MMQLIKYVLPCLLVSGIASASESPSSTTTLDGYEELSPQSKILVKNFMDRFDYCYNLSIEGDDYPIKSWLNEETRTNKFYILRYHSSYIEYMCSNKERQEMLHGLKYGNDNDIFVLSSLLEGGVLAEPILPPWITNEITTNIQELIKEYPYSFNYMNAFELYGEGGR